MRVEKPLQGISGWVLEREASSRIGRRHRTARHRRCTARSFALSLSLSFSHSQPLSYLLAGAKVTVTDIPPVTELMEQNVERAVVDFPDIRISARELDWNVLFFMLIDCFCSVSLYNFSPHSAAGLSQFQTICLVLGSTNFVSPTVSVSVISASCSHSGISLPTALSSWPMSSTLHRSSVRWFPLYSPSRNPIQLSFSATRRATRGRASSFACCGSTTSCATSTLRCVK